MIANVGSQSATINIKWHSIILVGYQFLASKNHGEKNSRRIMIVDDEKDILSILTKGLQQEGFHVDGYSDSRKALADFKSGQYDLLLFDIRMPGITGFELYREVRKVDRKVKVCFITAFEIYYNEFRRVFPKLHVSCFVRKPVTIKELARIVNEELARPALEEEEPTPRGSGRV